MGSEVIYYSFVFFSFLVLLYLNWKEEILVLSILVFYDGFFAFFSPSVWNGYKIFVLFYGLYTLFRYKGFNWALWHSHKGLNAAFFFFSLAFFSSAYLSNDYFILIFSQYAKYVMLILWVYLLKQLADKYMVLFYQLKKLVLSLLVIQIGLSVIKFFLFGVFESIVGTVSYAGGAAATSLPILGFIYMWVINDGKLKSRDWFIIFGLLFIGFVSMKRAIWFIMPIVVLFHLYYVPGKRISSKSLGLIFLVPIIFYLGVRFNPTLNKEHTYGGTFDIAYALGYAQEYSFGDEQDKGKGRGGATFLIAEKFMDVNMDVSTWFGYGLESVFATSVFEFDGTDYGIDHKGSATGVVQTYIYGGFLSILATLILLFVLVKVPQYKRYQHILLLFVLWEYLFYTGIVIRTPSLSFLFVFVMVYPRFRFNEQVLLLRENNKY